MSFSVVLIISLAAGVILVVGGGLMMYMGNLVRSAYELKVQINSEVDERLTKMAEELDKKSRWIKRDLLEEIDKIKVALQSDSARKFQELADPVVKRLGEYEEILRNERAEWVKAVESDRQNINALDQKIRMLRRDLKKGENGTPLPAEDSAGALDEAQAALAQPAVPAPEAPTPAPEAAPEPAPQQG
ncbi:MAG: hypothetical protein ACM31L_13335 [Actinomycetota bacterium]